MERLLIQYLNRNYYYFNGRLCRIYDGAYIDYHYFLHHLHQIFNISNEQIIMTLNDWFFDRFKVDSTNFWSPIKYLNYPYIISADVGEFTPNITMLARYGSNTINEDYYGVIRIGD